MKIRKIDIVLVLACASNLSAAPPKLWEQLSGDKALQHVQHLVDLGPRPPASAALEKSRVYIGDQLKSFGWEMTRQEFTEETPRGKVSFVNLIARFRGADKTAPSFLLCSHYDTKLFASIQFVGANDGGSSTGLLLEMARVLAQDPRLAAKIELVFFDGEEAFENFSDTDGVYGSRYFAKQLADSKTTKQFRGGILFDMIGDRTLTVTLSPNSPPPMAKGIFAAADALAVRSHFTFFGADITDDHTALNAVGIPTIDLIDFDFAWWHTAEDKIDKVSAESLQIVGRVAAYYLCEIALK